MPDCIQLGDVLYRNKYTLSVIKQEMLLSGLDNIFVLKQCTVVQVTINTTTASHHSPHSSWTLLVNTYMRQGSMNLIRDKELESEADNA